ncbi:inner membrane peptidase [Legionella geestiana]|uniref:Inner membrane peptidase n=1 Tax=Legionella geestiana TaxID=45065 RepID=A0A0W0UA37_9GAMM|nr:protease SohB [Legionella geestiana]KTD04856.1 inner membrane peptidase [Legionella geestiana]QBS11317.1 protease SohB [Legionella geestiana]STX54044.1 inner membrane peptidase [Legionella geestiana]
MDFLAQYGLFFLKAFTLVIALLLLFAGIAALSRKSTQTLDIRPLNDSFDALRKRLYKTVHGKKLRIKRDKSETRPAVFVIDFKGDIKASQVEALREEISAVLAVAGPKDEVMVRLESPGGMVSGYGLAASQLARLRERNIPLTVCIDRVAASGGYLMAAVANKVIAAPFAIVGSIGVVAQLPNFHRWLKERNIDVELITAGEYKRTLTVFGENTEKGRKKFQDDLEKIHHAFRDYVLSMRGSVNIKEVATGEHWLASDAMALGLVDALQTSDDWLLEKLKTANGFSICREIRQPLLTRLLRPAMQVLHFPGNF